jgi:archaellum component FlaD/FlaE
VWSISKADFERRIPTRTVVETEQGFKSFPHSAKYNAMSGRINPREYDLGELRDAVYETSRRDSKPPRPDERTDIEVQVTANTDTADHHSEPDVDRGGEQERVSAMEDPEVYLESRHRGRRGGRSQRDHEETAEGTGRNHTRERSRATPNPKSERIDIDFLAQRADGSASKPYLEELPGAYSAQLEIFEWLDLLVSKTGHEGAISALEYYESIEWLSAESRVELEEFVNGLTTTGSGSGSLGISDHRESLVYIARLAGRC